MGFFRFIPRRNAAPKPKRSAAQGLIDYLDTQYIETRQANEGVRTLGSALSQIEDRLKALEAQQQAQNPVE